MKLPKRIASPKKLLKTKLTAAVPTNNEKHFMVTQVIMPYLATDPIELIRLEAVHSRCNQLLPWQQLNDATIWLQGWV